MNVKSYRRRNAIKKFRIRLRHPWPLYKRIGNLGVVVIRANGTKEDLGVVADTYIWRWGRKKVGVSK